eukprot:NODE_2424_length_789_cov_8.909459_g1688_i0.p1 GENE.NODE_2424_length_789_cov_8.909459_g1688_i0~~NODE_2424_length_789_cov_8.909459_g1688_i0.p1  ORF type:complete len:129 (-),score=29.54 NODE_2424_length_789_cov_8.909459_g1688_i0:250-636(-)
MAGRVRSREDDWGSSGLPSATGTGSSEPSAKFHSRHADVNLAIVRPEELPAVAPEKPKCTNPIYKTSNTTYGSNADQALPNHAYHGKSGRFTSEFPAGTTATSAGLNTALSKSRVGPNPQFGRTPMDN